MIKAITTWNVLFFYIMTQENYLKFYCSQCCPWIWKRVALSVKRLSQKLRITEAVQSFHFLFLKQECESFDLKKEVGTKVIEAKRDSLWSVSLRESIGFIKQIW